MHKRNQAIINAIIAKAERDCPGALAMIGIYGSFLTGDIHEKSDLDLMILINDDRGYGLARTFIQEDAGIGHDLYCTTWEMLESDAEYSHPHISKLMDSRIVYCAAPEYQVRLETLREKARAQMRSPLTQHDLEKVRQHLTQAEHSFAQAIIADSMADIRNHGANLIYHLQSATAMLNKTYFRKGTRRVWDEIGAFSHSPKHFEDLANSFVLADTPGAAKEVAGAMMRTFYELFQAISATVATPKVPVSPDNLRGTYEEMFSNWRNKLYLAAQTGDAFLSFINLASMQEMLSDIEMGIQIGHYDVMACFHPEDLFLTARECDRVLTAYLEEYEKAGISPQRYPNIDAFIADYR